MGLTDRFWRVCTHADKETTDWLSRLWRTMPWLNAAMAVIAKYTPIVMLGVLVLAATGWFHTAGTAVALWGVSSSIVAAVVIRLLHEPVSKLTLRPRPFDTEPFEPLLEHDPGESFPSNHAGGALALACGAVHVAGFAPLLFILAILLCISRIYCGLHHLSDVVVGAAGGVVIGLICAQLPVLFHL